MNGGGCIAKATDTCSKPHISFYDFIQSFHEGIHDWLRSERFEAVFDFCKCRMPSSLTNSNIDDVHVLQRSFKDSCAKLGTLIGEFRQCSIWRHFFRWDKNRDVGHFGSTVTFWERRHCRSSIALSSAHRDAHPSEDIPRWGQWSAPASPATDVRETSPMRRPASDKA